MSRTALAIAGGLLLSACVRDVGNLRTSAALPEASADRQNADAILGQQTGAAEARKRWSGTPKPVLTGASGLRAQPASVPALEGEALALNVEAMPLPAFINEVFGNLLKLPFEMESALQGKADLVTLRVAEPQDPSQVFILARQVLRNYGVGIEESGGLYRFVVTPASGGAEPPLMVSGRALPDVPASHRPVFQLVPLKAVTNMQITTWLRQAYGEAKVKIYEDPDRNAILLQGPPQDIQNYLQAISVLDQPLMRSQHSIKLEPLYAQAEPLALQLVELLKAEGYAATLRPPIGSIIVMPFKDANFIVVFANDADTLEHVKEWAQSLDQPAKNESEDGLFVYRVRNTGAEELASTIGQLLGGGGGRASGGGDASASAPQGLGRSVNLDAAAPKAAGSGSALSTGAGLVVDKERNALIFQGTAKSWSRMLPVIRELDQPSRQVLVEVVIAELSLDQKTEIGFDWSRGLPLPNGVPGVNAYSLNGTTGLAYTFESAGTLKTVLTAFAKDDNFNILSTPRLMVNSGAEASMEVGDDVPLLTSQLTVPGVQNEGGQALQQNVQYRRTGVLLTVKPVIHSGDRIDLEISQEVSELPEASSSSLTPTVSNRSIKTRLSLKDGSTVMLAGLIKRKQSAGRGGVPLLKDLPLVGGLFSKTSDAERKSELLLLIRPYILSTAGEAEAITKGVMQALDVREETLATDSGRKE